MRQFEQYYAGEAVMAAGDLAPFGKDPETGREVQWYVIRVERSSALLILRFFAGEMKSGDCAAAMGRFADRVLAPEDRERVLTAPDADGNQAPGGQLFLLSAEEIQGTLVAPGERITGAKRGAEPGEWWTAGGMAYVAKDGLIFDTGEDEGETERGLRPAVWIRIPEQPHDEDEDEDDEDELGHKGPGIGRRIWGTIRMEAIDPEKQH